MYPILLHIYGPIALHSYGVCIALGVTLTSLFIFHDKRRSCILSDNQFFSLPWIGIWGLIGGRILYVLEHPQSITSLLDIVIPWNGGLSILGGVLGCILFLFWFTYQHNIPRTQFLDIIGTYAPIAHAFGRLGCFFAGCCCGQITAAWGITYPPSYTWLPTLPLYPTQLYSALLHLLTFALLFILPRKKILPGIIFLLYLSGTLINRFIIGFWRYDYILQPKYMLWGVGLTFNQVASLILLSVTILLASVYYLRNR